MTEEDQLGLAFERPKRSPVGLEHQKGEDSEGDPYENERRYERAEEAEGSRWGLQGGGDRRGGRSPLLVAGAPAGAPRGPRWPRVGGVRVWCGRRFRRGVLERVARVVVRRQRCIAIDFVKNLTRY